MVVATKLAQNFERTQIKISYNNQKSNKAKLPLMDIIKQRDRKIFFSCKIESKYKLKADLMLTLNKTLQKTEIDPKVRFCCIKYLLLGSISALFIEKVDVTMLFL